MSSANKFQIQIRYVLLPLFFAILIYVGYLASYVGFFRPVVISEKKAGPFIFLYKEHVGAYHKIVPIIESVETWAKENGLSCKLSFGKYLDDPNTVEEARLKSIGGCLVTEQEYAVAKDKLPEGFKLETLAEAEFVVAQFEGSPGIGPMKVYPKVYEYFENQRIARGEYTLEIYEIHSQEAMTTVYYFPKR